ncbi:MAG TPA: hypothetical protein VM347_44370 [Nonomuraea sp.]|nr:hypothetical protein [Nonomuraea sp.]
MSGWDKRRLLNKQPCADCPFRKASAKGWLGGHPLDAYAQPPGVGMPTSCHRTDRGADNPRTGFCAGSLAMIANSGVQPLADYADAAAQVGPRDDCIEDEAAFREHHAFATEFRSKLHRDGVAP